MRKSLIAAVAMAPLYLAAGVASAATTISTSQNGPVATATTGDLTVSSGVTVTVPTAGTSAAPADGLILNSNNVITNSGAISSNNLSNVVGIQVNGGNTGSLDSSGAITLTSSFTAPNNADGYVAGPFAGTASPSNPSGTGVYSLTGIRVSGTNPFIGFIINEAGGSIAIKGNNSYGISLETGITGKLTSAGAISMTGDNNVGLRTTAGSTIGGGLSITGGISVQGQNSSAVSLAGNVTGRLNLAAAITATGYALTSRVSDTTLLAKLQTASNNQIQQSAAAFIIGGSVSGGVYLAGAPLGTVSGSTADVTGDGAADASEGTGSIAIFGNAPALLIGSASNAITLGGFSGTTTMGGVSTGASPDNGFGLIIRGSISAAGVYDGVAANAVQIGADTTGLGTGAGTGSVYVTGGLRLYGSVSASAYSANATGIHLFNATVPTFDLNGSLTASIAASTTTVSANGLLIESGGALQTLNVRGTLIAAAAGDYASAVAVRDLSGTLNSVLNVGGISASNSVTTLGDTQHGSAIALDLSHNTTGVTLVQKTNPTPTYVYGDTSGSDHTTSTTNTAGTPFILGDVLLGNGVNSVSLLAGSLTGALSMGNASGGSLLIDNGATYSGPLTYAGSGANFAINVNNGTLDDSSATTIHAKTLNVGANSVLTFAVDPVNNAASTFVVSQSATIASGAKFGLTLLSAPTSAQSFTVISAPSLTLGSTTTLSLDSTPYLLSASINGNASAGTVTVNIRRKSATEMGLNTSEASALNPILAASAPGSVTAAGDPQLQAAILAPTSSKDFFKTIDQFLPDSTGAVFEASRLASEAISRATAAQDQTPGAAGTRGYWTQEFVIGAHSDRTDQNIAYDVGGFGVVAGAAFGGHGWGAAGVTAAFTSSTVTNPILRGDTQQAVTNLEAGAYWQASIHGLTLDTRLGLGFTTIDGRRQLYTIDNSGNISANRRVSDNRNGYTVTAHAGAGYEFGLGAGFYLRPQAHVDYFGLNEDSYKENDPVGNGFALNVSSRNGSATSSTATLVLGRSVGSDFRVRSEVELGVHDTFSGDAGATTAKFVSGGSSFVLSPSDISGAGGVARLAIKGSTDFYEIGVQAGVEQRDKFYSGEARVTVRLLF